MRSTRCSKSRFSLWNTTVFSRDGYEALENLVRAISTVSNKVVWMPLGCTVTSSCVLKRTGDDQFTLRHFWRYCDSKIPVEIASHVEVEKPEQEGLVEAVIVGGQQVPFEVNSGLLKYSAHLQPQAELNVNVVYRQMPRSSRNVSWKYRFDASARRVLSEVRDNHLARNQREC